VVGDIVVGAPVSIVDGFIDGNKVTHSSGARGICKCCIGAKSIP
jgi:hypothetical protein